MTKRELLKRMDEHLAFAQEEVVHAFDDLAALVKRIEVYRHQVMDGEPAPSQVFREWMDKFETGPLAELENMASRLDRDVQFYDLAWAAREAIEVFVRSK